MARVVPEDIPIDMSYPLTIIVWQSMLGKDSGLFTMP